MWLTVIWSSMQIEEGVISWGKMTALQDICISDHMKAESNFNYNTDQVQKVLCAFVDNTGQILQMFLHIIWKQIQ